MESLFATMTLKQVIEALVFASPKPLLTKEIVAALRAAGEGTEDQNALDFAKAKADDVLAALAELQTDFGATGRAFQIVERINGWTLVSEPACAPWVRQLYPEAKPTRLSGPQLETLAIIAYRQPVTRADIEAVRGVAVDGVMQILLDRGLVKIAGRAEVPGRPLLYSTTEYFLEHFGLKTTDELPNASELKRVVLPTAPAPEEAKPAEAAVEPEGAAAEPAAEAEAVPANEVEATAAESEPEPEPAPEPEPEPEPTPENEAPETATEPPAHE
ncbi:MAG: SMC-Scp complex subunit ScpB [Chthoniobacter sp.]